MAQVTALAEVLKSSPVNVVAQAEKQQLMISAEHLRKLYSPKPELRDLYAQVLVVIGHVENAKQIHLSDKERQALGVSLVNSGKTIQEIAQMGEFVKRNKDYARIPYDVWINAEPIYTASEMKELIDNEIDRRRRAMNDMKIPEAEIEASGLVSLRHVYARRIQVYREKVGATLEKRAKKVERFLKLCPEAIKIEVAGILNSKGLLGNDPHWRQILPYFAPHVLTEVEAIMNRKEEGKHGVTRKVV